MMESRQAMGFVLSHLSSRDLKKLADKGPLQECAMSRLPKKTRVVYLHATGKAFGFDIDCKRLLNEFESWGTLLSAPIYYTTIIEDQEFS